MLLRSKAVVVVVSLCIVILIGIIILIVVSSDDGVDSVQATGTTIVGSSTTTTTTTTTTIKPRSTTTTTAVSSTTTTTTTAGNLPTCPMAGDQVCDDTNNHLGCNFDDGDCCLTTPDCTYCTDCLCIQEQTSYCLETTTVILHTNTPFGGEECMMGIGDNLCDGYNNEERCDYDGGDCCSGADPYCLQCSGANCICHETGEKMCLDSTCLFGGDGWCHDLNNVPDCNFDDGDCCLESPVCMIPIMCTECLCHEDQTSHCPDQVCVDKWMDDGQCDGDNNLEECEYDGGDCCSGTDPGCNFCEGEGCICHLTGEAMCSDQPVCNDEVIEDGTCHGSNNNKECGYDGNDCCLGLDTRCYHCSGDECLCHESGLTFCSGTCQFGDDLYCDHDNNNEACNYDDGDCCMEDLTDCSYCEGNCICHEDGIDYCTNYQLFPEFSECGISGGVSDWVGDYYCDDVNNHEACSYDGGDCCLEEINTDYCEICECMES